MMSNIYAIHDKKTGSYYTPFTTSHDEQAKRSFVGAVGNDKTDFFRYPSDFDLYRLGMVDHTSGRLTSCDAPEFIMSGVEAKEIARSQHVDNS